MNTQFTITPCADGMVLQFNKEGWATPAINTIVQELKERYPNDKIIVTFKDK